jgi:hypothetical protein
MAEAAVAAEIHQALDVHLNLAPKVALDLVVRLQDLTDPLDLTLGELLRHPVPGYPRLVADAARRGLPDAEEVRERINDVLVTGKVDACYAGHVFSLLALPLLVAGVFANDPDDALAANHFTFVADLLDAGPDFHGFLTCAGR